MATVLSGVFAISVGFASNAMATTVSDAVSDNSPFSSLGVFSAVVAAFIFMLKRSDGRDNARIEELTRIIVDVKEELKQERIDHDATRAELVKVLRDTAAAVVISDAKEAAYLKKQHGL